MPAQQEISEGPRLLIKRKDESADARRNLLQFSIIAFVIAGLGTRAFMTGRGM